MDILSYVSFDEPAGARQFLDLNRHHPQEYEGKWITCHGRDYQVGEFLGAGHEKRVHKLYNGLSGGCLHVLKVQHDQQNAAVASRHLLKILDRWNAKSADEGRLPDSILVESPLGIFNVEEVLLTGFERRDRGTYELFAKAEAYHKAGDRSAAIAELDGLLRRFPNHTIALNNMAALYAMGDDYNTATAIQRLAVYIEPNHRTYRLALLSYALKTSDFQFLRSEFLELHEVFPYAHDLDDKELDVLLAIGEPAEADRRFQRAVLSEENKPLYRTAIDKALTGKECAVKTMATLERSFMDGKPLPVKERLRLLDNAYRTYDRDPFLCLNLGLTRNLTHPVVDSLALFQFAGATLAKEFGPSCYANAAFGCIKRSDFDSATRMFYVAQFRLSELCDGKEPELRLIPGVANFVSPHFIQELPDELEPILDAYLAGVSNRAPRSVAELVVLMLEADRYVRNHHQSTPEEAQAAIAAASRIQSSNS